MEQCIGEDPKKKCPHCLGKGEVEVGVTGITYADEDTGKRSPMHFRMREMRTCTVCKGEKVIPVDRCTTRLTGPGVKCGPTNWSAEVKRRWFPTPHAQKFPKNPCLRGQE